MGMPGLLCRDAKFDFLGGVLVGAFFCAEVWSFEGQGDVAF